jgi:hypothetical protein
MPLECGVVPHRRLSAGAPPHGKILFARDAAEYVALELAVFEAVITLAYLPERVPFLQPSRRGSSAMHLAAQPERPHLGYLA